MSHFEIKTGVLQQATSAMLSVIPTSRTARDSLKCFKFKTYRSNDEDRLSLQASDSEMFASVEIKSDLLVNQTGEFLVPAQIFAEFIKSINSDKVLIRLEENGVVTVVSENSNFELGATDLDEYPPFPEILNGTSIKVNSEDFAKVLEKVQFAVADKSHPKFNFTSVCLLLEPQLLTLMGGDSHRASMAVIPTTGASITEPFQVLVSPKPLEQIAKTFSNDIEFIFSKNSVIAKSDPFLIILQVLNGSFPSMRDVLPKHPLQFNLNAKEILSCAKRALLATDNQNSLRVALRKGAICLTAKTREQRKSAKVECSSSYDGPDFEFAIDGKYLVDVLKVVDGEITLHFNNEGGPLLFTQENFNHLMVPMEI